MREISARINDTERMTRRDFLTHSSATLAIASLGSDRIAVASKPIDSEWYGHARCFADLSISRVAYVEHGHGPVALFVHGYPLNGYQWRGALERLHKHRRCIAPDVMGMGYTETTASQTISPETQADMLAMLIDKLKIDSVDLVANDSGGLVSQHFLAKYPQRVRTLLLTNCDVDENSPPTGFVPFINLAKNGTFVEKVIAPQLNNKRSCAVSKRTRRRGLHLSGQTYRVATPLKQSQVNAYAVSMGINTLVEIRENLHQWKCPARMVGSRKTRSSPYSGPNGSTRTCRARAGCGK